MDRDQIVRDMETARSRLLAALAGLAEEDSERRRDDGWSVKDDLGHIAMCDEIRFFEINRVSRGGRPAFHGLDGAPMDAFNEIIASQRRSLPLKQLVADLAAARKLVLDAIADASDRALDPSNYGDFAVTGSINHDNDHAETIEAWRKKSGI